ncbi:hypothetical protein ACWDVX_16960 [Streptomyces tendae]
MLAPIPKGAGASPSARSQAEALASRGVRVALLTPDRAARRAFGRNALDAARIPGAAREGRRQGAAHAERIGEIWRG